VNKLAKIALENENFRKNATIRDAVFSSRFPRDLPEIYGNLIETIRGSEFISLHPDSISEQEQSEGTFEDGHLVWKIKYCLHGGGLTDYYPGASACVGRKLYVTYNLALAA